MIVIIFNLPQKNNFTNRKKETVKFSKGKITENTYY
ncbi:hypothetical protein J2T04_000258 [Chryseobacterium lathyri]|uniref:Uncharacterized protein n=1 Tax=Chryseobacterium lathyri TaxID=395933 RepID=A0ABT9SHS6_9FLAO|nr:hypothetical protein [Chryseobacterium lathyri]MDQ0066424.1 hypothetical protein [Chryseobacterium lathyri]